MSTFSSIFRASGLIIAAAVLSLTYASSGDSFTVHLQKQHVPVIVNNRVIMHKTAYYGDIYVGRPYYQNFTVVFDTGSGHIILPSVSCHNESCLLHNRYNRSESESAVDVNFDGSITNQPPDGARDRATVQYGTGDVLGPIVKDVVCVGNTPQFNTTDQTFASSNHSAMNLSVADGNNASNATGGSSDLPLHCSDVWFVASSRMSTEPFRSFTFDGIYGLGLAGLALEPPFHALTAMSHSRGVDQFFGIFLSKDLNGSQITFGGVDRDRMLASLQWEDLLRAEEGYWRIQLKGVTIGGKRLEACDDGECSGIVDSGTSLLGVPSFMLQQVLGLTTIQLDPDIDFNDYDCRQKQMSPSIVFELGTFSIDLPSKEYFRTAPANVTNKTTGLTKSICRASLLPVNMPPLGKKVFMLGEPILQRYYTAYDVVNSRVGFALSNQESAQPTPFLDTKAVV